MTTHQETDEDLRAVDGRVPGRRGRQTRDRLLDATAELLQTRGYRELSVVEIARHVGSSPATFYQYFADVEAAVLVLAARLHEDGERLGDLISSASWSGRAGWEATLDFIDAFLDFWTTHVHVLRVIDLAIAEGDGRFREARIALLNPVTVALCEVVAEMQARERHPEDVKPNAQASVIISMLAHVAAHLDGLTGWGVGEKEARVSLARMTYWSLVGRKPPAD